jgi:ABC-type uncharacterized transport system auxiliary subunit
MKVANIKYWKNSCYILVTLVLSFLATSCLSIDIKSDFIETKYYNLEKSKEFKDFGKILKGDVFVSKFSLAEDISEDLIMVEQRNGIRAYHYHRWVSSLGQMVRDYFIYELSSGNFTSGRILSKPNLRAPDYRIEVRIHRWIAVNLGDDSGVELSVEISLLDKKNEILLNKIYEKTSPRQEEEVQTIAPAFSLAINDVLGEFARDVKDKLNGK